MGRCLALVLLVACSPSQPEPLIDRIEPGSATNTFVVSVRIEGSAFHLPLTSDLDNGTTIAGDVAVTVGTALLGDVVWRGEQLIEGSVPTGLDVGPHDVRVTLGSRSGVLAAGYTVIESERVFSVDPGPRHLGDNLGPVPPTDPEGTSITTMFSTTSACLTATLKMRFPGPYGPRRDLMPTIQINGVDLGSIRPFFPPDNDPGWGIDPDKSYDGNPPVLVMLECGAALTLGNNTFVITAVPGDDIYYDEVVVGCQS